MEYLSCLREVHAQSSKKSDGDNGSQISIDDTAIVKDECLPRGKAIDKQVLGGAEAPPNLGVILHYDRLPSSLQSATAAGLGKLPLGCEITCSISYAWSFATLDPVREQLWTIF